MKKLLIASLILCFTFADEFVEATTNIGGYGELHWNMEGEEMDFHRFIVFLNHNFDDKWSLKSEIELEHNMAGDGYGGYIALEQAYMNYMGNNWDFKGGVVLAPVGIINPVHEPPTFMSVERPDYAKYIIPSTWFGNGLGFGYKMGDFSFGLTLMEDIIGAEWADLKDADGNELGYNEEGDGTPDTIISGAMDDDKYAFRSGRGKGDASYATSLTKIINIGYAGGIEGLKAGFSMVMNDMPHVFDGDIVEGVEPIGLSFNELNVQYNANNIVAVFETGSGEFDYDAFNAQQGTTHAKGFEGMRLDLGYNVGSLMGDCDCELYLWTRLTSWDANTELSTNVKNGEVSKSLLGVTWKPKSNISFKLESGTMTQEWTEGDGGKNESDILNFGIGYMF